MAEHTGIEWTDHTFNPWIGCTGVSPACDHCYARALVNGRMGGDFDQRRRTVPGNWKQPLRWNQQAMQEGRPQRVFCASLADVFDNQVPPEWRIDLFDLIRTTPWLRWQLLTKRPQNIAKMLPWNWGIDWPNVWLGTTVENQVEADRRIPHLRSVRAAVRFLSVEPLLERVDLDLDGIGWVIVGGESGPGARPLDPQWVRPIREQCVAAGVPLFFKQWGDWHEGLRVGKKKAGNLLDGRVHQEWPDAA